MSMTLVEIIATACNELGLVAPTIVAASTDLQIKQLFALVNRDGIELYKSHDWTCLQGEHIINVAAPVVTTGDLTEGSTDITNIPSTTGIVAGQFALSGEGVPQAQRISTVLGTTSVRCEMEQLDTAAGVALTFVRDTYELPANFDHYSSETWWDRTNHWMLIGPDSAQWDHYIRSGIFASGPRRRWRQIGVKPTIYRLWPPPTAQDTPAALVFEYISDGWVEHVDGTFGKRFTADTDVPLLDEDALVLGVKWRMWQIKGFDYTAMQAEYVDYVNRERARDGGIPDLSISKRAEPWMISDANIQDGDWPGSE